MSTGTLLLGVVPFTHIGQPVPSAPARDSRAPRASPITKRGRMAPPMRANRKRTIGLALAQHERSGDVWDAVAGGAPMLPRLPAVEGVCACAGGTLPEWHVLGAIRQGCAQWHPSTVGATGHRIVGWDRSDAP